MEQMNFGDKWRRWILGCLSSARASVLINGSPTLEFNIKRGIRQGDPLSSFLFAIALEGLSVSIKEACSQNLFDGVSLPNNGPTISHLMYADDVSFVGEWSESNLINLNRILRCFYIALGLKVNLHKSKVFGVGVDDIELNRFASILSCKPATLLCTYLGLPIGCNMKRVVAWNPVVEKFKEKLSIWKAKALSFGGRLTLVKSVLSSLPLYYFSLFKAPSKVIEKLESIRRNFLWGGDENKKKIHWIAWDNIIKPKWLGGLGVGCLLTMNIALLAKWLWRLKVEDKSLWKRCISAIHKIKGFDGASVAKKGIPGTWRVITESCEEMQKWNVSFHDLFERKVNSGDKTFFWKDV